MYRQEPEANSLANSYYFPARHLCWAGSRDPAEERREWSESRFSSSSAVLLCKVPASDLSRPPSPGCMIGGPVALLQRTWELLSSLTGSRSSRTPGYGSNPTRESGRPPKVLLPPISTSRGGALDAFSVGNSCSI